MLPSLDFASGKIRRSARLRRFASDRYAPLLDSAKRRRSAVPVTMQGKCLFFFFVALRRKRRPVRVRAPLSHYHGPQSLQSKLLMVKDNSNPRCGLGLLTTPFCNAAGGAKRGRLPRRRWHSQTQAFGIENFAVKTALLVRDRIALLAEVE